MTTNEERKAVKAESLWKYALSVGPVSNTNFKLWYINRAINLHMMSEAEALEHWHLSLKMHG